jgi:AraC-like DNA-binding protein/quercetin dioxygenase-like cupin family protein
MNYKALDNLLKSEIAYTHMDDQAIYERICKKYPSIPYHDTEMFDFRQDREFQNRNHIVSLHQRNSGKIPLHIYNYVVLTYVYSGTFHLTVETEKITLNAGDIIILDKNIPHAVEATGENDLGINIILHYHFFQNRFINKLPANQPITKFIVEFMNNQNRHNHYLLFQTSEDHLIHNSIQNILCEYFEPYICSDDIIDNYIMILISLLSRKETYNTNLSINKQINRELISKIIQYVEVNYQSGNLSEMSDTLGYNSSYISKFIKQFSGQTFKQLINNQRMRKTATFLDNTDLPIYEIANEVGIPNLTSFYKRFRVYSGLSPQEYRKR